MKFKTNMVTASQISFKTKSYLNIINNQAQYIKKKKITTNIRFQQLI